MVDAAAHLGICLPPEAFDEVFPFHFAFGPDWRVVRQGRSLARVCPRVVAGAKFNELFAPIRPEAPFDFEEIVQNRRSLFLIKEKATGVLLRGQMLSLRPKEDLIVFLGSPWLAEASAISQFGLSFDDFAIHDPALDLLHVLQTQKIATGDLQRLTAKLQSQRATLRETNARLTAQQAEHRKLALIAARTDNAVVLTDAQGLIEWVNEGFVRLTGYTLEEVRGRKPGTLLQGPDTDPDTVRFIRQQLTKGEGFSVELLNYGKHGQKYWLAIEVQPIRDESGRITNFMAIESNITQRKLADRRLAVQYSVSRTLTQSDTIEAAMPRILEALCENLGWQLGALWTLTPGGHQLSCAATWHHPQSDVASFLLQTLTIRFRANIGLPGRIWASGEPLWIRDVTCDTNFSRSAAAAQDQLHGAFGFPIQANGAFWGVFEFFSRRIEEPDGDLLRMFSATAGQIGQFIVRKQAEAALREANTLQRAILAGAGYAIISTTPAGTIVTFNRAAEQMLGYRAEELVGRSTPAVFHDLEEVARRAAELTQELGREVPVGFEAFVAKARLGKQDEREWTYVCKNGSRFPVILSVTALFDEKNEVTGFLGVAADITERKRDALELLQAKEAAESANRAKSEFLATMSHELRTPINGIIGTTEVLTDTLLEENQRENLRVIRHSGEALLAIIDDVLDFSKIEAGMLEMESIPFDLLTCLQEVFDIVSSKAAQKELDLICRVDAAVPTQLLGDITRLRQILLNLIGNAIKFTERGEIVVQVEVDTTHGPVENAPAVPLLFSVRDTGVGISPEKQGRLFQPFTQADSSNARHFGGTGLGLSISRRLVELMGGRIWLESQLGEGSKFCFSMVLPTSEPKGRAPWLEPQPPLAGKKILLVEDNLTFQAMFQELGQRWNLFGVSAVTAQQALDALAHGASPDVVILDEQMPGANLPLLVERIKQPKAGKRPKLVLLTSRRTARETSPAAALNETFRLSKPIWPQQFLEALLRAVNSESAVPAPLASSHDATLGARMPLRILLADDNKINQDVGLGLLRRLGFKADVVGNGVEALKALETQRYDLLLLDLQMPEMDGYETMRQIVAKWPEEERPVVMAMTASVLARDRERCRLAGMNDFLVKPVRTNNLQALITKWYPAMSAKKGASPASAAIPSAPEPAAPEAVSGDAPIDFACIEEISYGDPASSRELIQVYLTQANEIMAKLAAALANGVLADAGRHAHKLAGSSAICGINQLASNLTEIELACDSGELAKAQRLFTATGRLLQTASQALNDYLESKCKARPTK